MKMSSVVLVALFLFVSAHGAEEPCVVHRLDDLIEVNAAEDPAAEYSQHLVAPAAVCFDREARYDYAMAGGFACMITPIVFEQSVITDGANGVNSVYAIDLDGDSDIDVASASSQGNTVEWYENLGGDPPAFTTHVLSDDASAARSVHAIDVDGDTDIDIVSCAAIDGTVSWFENLGGKPPNFTEHVVTSSENFPQSVFAMDINGDGDVDLLSGSSGNDRIRWYENNGGSPPSFIPRTVTTTANSVRSVYAADVNGDGDMDILSASSFDGTVAWYENNGGNPPSFTKRVLTSSASSANSVFAIDLDHDDDIDVLYAAPSGDRVAWFENDGAVSPTFIEHEVTTAQDGPQAVFAADIDNDTHIDVLVASNNDDTFAWHVSDGGTPPTFSLLATVAADGARTVVAADVDGDSKMDMVGGSTFDDTVAWYDFREPPLGACCLADSSCQPDTCMIDCADLEAWGWNEGVACEDVTCPGIGTPADIAVDLLEFDLFKQKVFDLAAFGTRHWTQPGNALALDYIEEKLRSYGYDTVVRDPYIFQNQLRHNMYVTKRGTVRPTEMYILGGHMDSFNINGNQADAPGADDDGSGTSSVMEMARVFAQVHTEVSIRFALWNNEETGLNGSTAYVAGHEGLQGTLEEPTWLGMIQQDMIMYDHGPGKIPDADVEYQSNADAGGAAVIFAHMVNGAMTRYGTIPSEVGDNMAFTDSVPFQGVTAAISVRENERIAEIGNGSNPHWHQPSDNTDTYTDVDYNHGFNICRMICGAIGELVNVSVYGDQDNDGDIDIDDWAGFLDCVTGPGGGIPEGCGPFDIDFDGDIDFTDAGRLQLAFTG